ncbi:MAG: hypothetical protein Q9164_000972 [Protoblastenia rupestris]
MASPRQIVLAFDLYGTLLSTDSIAKQLSTHFGNDKAAALASLWRRYQLEYTWRSNSMMQYIPFSTITRRSLSHALAESSLALGDSAIDSVMKAYDSLSTFPDVAPALQSLAEDPGIISVVFSNGTHSMVTNSVKSSPDLAPHVHVFKDIVTVDEVRRFKPDPEVYYFLARKVGKDTSREGMSGMWLVSGNPFDVVGAKAVGMRACWVDRAGKGWVDGLSEGEEGRPDLIVQGLGEVVEGVRRYARE